ncbi:MAG: hypothetical protein RI935_119 [Candidatus Parcubacteria bacterium]|jgi:hypothetical protein
MKLSLFTNHKTLSILNSITGIALITAGVFYFYKTKTFDMSLSWIIFGVMYLVMESYPCDCRQPKRVVIFAWIGMILSLLLAFYYMVTL